LKIGRRIREARKAARLTLAELAKATRTMSPSRLSNYEHGRRTPGPGDIDLIAKALRKAGCAVTAAYLLGVDDELARQEIANLRKLQKILLDLLTPLPSRDVDENLLREGVRSLAALLEARHGAIALFDENARHGHFIHAGVAAEEARRLGRRLPDAVAEQEAVPRPEDGAAAVPTHRPPVKALLVVPIVYQGKAYGRIYLGDKAGDASFDDEDERQATLFADTLAVMFELRRLEAEREQTQERLRQMALYDSLTGLPNRKLLDDRLRQVLIDADRNEHLIAVLFLDLDRFKHVNDTFGHGVGDELLRTVAQQLNASTRACDIVARLGGDEFIVVLPNIHHADEATSVVQKIQSLFAAPFRVGGRELHVSTSIGVTIYPLDDGDVESLLKSADAAMYHAKQSGRNTFRFYTADLHTRAIGRIALEDGLRRALERRELVLHYQPQVELETGRLVAMEALLRWRHPEKGLIAPLEFIPIAEETGLIAPIGEWVLRTACAQAKTWQRMGLPPLRVAVNLSSRQLRQKGFVQAVRHAVEESGIEASLLDLELTENALLHDAESAVGPLEALKALGVSCTLDDFGAGYSSLSSLRRLPIGCLKIDPAFVRDIAVDPRSAALARAIVALAHALDRKVVAEGVESREQRELLRRWGCGAAQGYLYGKPLPAGEATALVRDWRRIR
jgi:diguanylate cyclase (GGDEF)-like protein